MKRTLFISPHLDDAVLSCGAAIAAIAENGFEVIVVTIFTHPGNDAPEKIKALYQKRRSDDRQAVAMLGAYAVHLDFPDAPFRNHRYHNFSSILFHHLLPNEEKSVKEAVVKQLKRLVNTFLPAEIFFPLGVGGHIDHHIVFESSKCLGNSQTKISYYEDLPYALLPGWNAVRWHHVKGIPFQIEHNRHEKKMSLIATPFPFVHNYITSAEDQLDSVIRYDEEWSAVNADMFHATAWELERKPFFSCPYNALHNKFIKKCDAISCYSTEWPILFGSEESNIQLILGTGIRDNVYSENQWLGI